MWKSKAQFEFIHKRMYKDMSDINECLRGMQLEMIDRLNTLKPSNTRDPLIEKQVGNLADMISLTDDYTKMLRDTDSEYKTDVLDELDKASQDKARLEEKVAQQDSLIAELKKDNTTLLNKYSSLLEQVNQNITGLCQ